MKTFRLHKVATLVAALALASAGIAGDACSRGGGGVVVVVVALAAAVVAAWEAAVATAAVGALAAVV